MKSAVIVFPGSNCDRDLAVAIRDITGSKPEMVWHRDTDLPSGVGLIAVPGGFSYGDYLRSGAMAARSPIMGAIVEAAGQRDQADVVGQVGLAMPHHGGIAACHLTDRYCQIAVAIRSGEDDHGTAHEP